MAHTYILYSKKIDKYYIGSCLGSISARIKKHNESFYGRKSFTSRSNDWKLFLSIETEDKMHAMRLERKIKSMKSRVYIQNLLKYKELREKILKETIIH